MLSALEGSGPAAGHMTPSLLELPSECLLAVLDCLAVEDILSLGSTSRAACELAQDDGLWRSLAARKWGPAALTLWAEDAGPWKSWCCKRMSLKRSRPSPLRLLQESYPDPWQHIVACVLCSRTSGGPIIYNTVAAFFDAFPTPSAVLEASDSAVKELIHPLGLQPSRLAAVRGISQGFLATDWEEPSEFYGCGRFVADSWRIFCRGDLSGKGVEDANLKRYISWAKHGTMEPKKAKQGRPKAAAGPSSVEAQKRSAHRLAKRSRADEATSEPAAQRITRARAAGVAAGAAAGASGLNDGSSNSRAGRGRMTRSAKPR